MTDEENGEELTMYQVRLPINVLDRARALVPRLRRSRELRDLGRLTLTTVVRMALVRGLEVLEQQYPEPTPGEAQQT
jgi:hypothetical protein